MLIISDKERGDILPEPGKLICQACSDVLYYPFIVVSDRDHSAYHIKCAIAIASELSEGIVEVTKDLIDVFTAFPPVGYKDSSQL